jgi:hypothetical protein
MEKLRFCSVLFNLFNRRKKPEGTFVWYLGVEEQNSLSICFDIIIFLKFFDHAINVVLAINVALAINVVLSINVVTPINVYLKFYPYKILNYVPLLKFPLCSRYHDPRAQCFSP